MKVMGIFAHADDESFGALQALLKHKEEGDSLHLVHFTHAREAFEGFHKAADYLNATITVMTLPDQKLEQEDFQALIAYVQTPIAEAKPDIVYTNFIGDLNRDHRVIAEAVMVACRPYKENAPKEVWMCAVPSTTELGFRPIRKDMLVEITPQKEKLLREWYPQELINGRYPLPKYEVYELWPSAH